jgi:hypothetical protein
MSKRESNESNNNQLDEVNPCKISLLFWLGGVINNVQNCFINIYSSNDIIRHTTDYLAYSTTSICNSFQKKKTDPNEYYWWCKVRIIKSVFGIDTLEEEFNYEKTIQTVSITPGDLIIYHTPNYVICSQYNRIYNKIPINSNIRFLSIEYCHPGIDEPIQLVLEKDWCIVSNEIFTYTHVFRMLQYQVSEEEYIFDERYFLKLIDSNINILEITSGQYIRLESDDYTVIG